MDPEMRFLSEFVYMLLLTPLLLAHGSYNVYFHSPVGPSTLNRPTPEPQNLLANYRRSQSMLRRGGALASSHSTKHLVSNKIYNSHLLGIKLVWLSLPSV